MLLNFLLPLKLDFSIVKIWINVCKNSNKVPLIKFRRSIVDIKAVTVPVPGKTANYSIRIIYQLVLSIPGASNNRRDN